MPAVEMNCRGFSRHTQPPTNSLPKVTIADRAAPRHGSFHNVGKCLPTAIGDYIQNHVGANRPGFDVMFSDHTGEPERAAPGTMRPRRPAAANFFISSNSLREKVPLIIFFE